MRELAAACHRHRVLVVALWLAVLAAAIVAAQVAGDSFVNNFSLPSSDSIAARNLLSSAFPQASGDVEEVVFHVRSGSVRDPAVRARLTQALHRIAGLPHVTGVREPFSGTGGGVSADGRTGFAAVQWDLPASRIAHPLLQRLVAEVHAARAPGLQVEVTGQAVEQLQQAGPGASEVWGVLAAIVVLLFAFGSVVAMLLPVLVALIALGAGLEVIVLLSHVFDLATFAPQLAGMIGLGVGIDYALFIVSRFRSSLRDGHSVDEAVVVAVDSSGRAVVFAGTTVVVSLLGMLVLRIDFVRGMAIAAAVTVLFTMAASITLLPALLSLLGRRVNALRIPLRHPERASARSHAWRQWSAAVQRVPWLAAIAATVALLLLAAPAMSLRLGSLDAGSDPKGTTTREAYDLLAAAFGPGFNATLVVVVRLPAAGATGALAPLERAVAATPDVVRVLPARLSPDRSVAVLTVYPRSAPQDEGTVRVVHALRERVVPAALAGSGAVAHVGGVTAVTIDLGAVLARRVPVFIAAVVFVSVLLLTAVFRSVIVPVKAAVMNLMSIAAAFGVVTAVFQWGWLASALGVDRPGPVESFLPVMLFAILFGLSMDYEVFLLSRMHEEWVRTGDNSVAVREGIASTGSVITAAAAIMIVVFSSFLLLGQHVISEFGLGLAVAVFLDALVIRMVLVPALMQLLGGSNWYLPRWLRWMPVLHLDATEVDQAGAGQVREPSITG